MNAILYIPFTYNQIQNKEKRSEMRSNNTQQSG